MKVHTYITPLEHSVTSSPCTYTHIAIAETSYNQLGHTFSPPKAIFKTSSPSGWVSCLFMSCWLSLHCQWLWEVSNSIESVITVYIHVYNSIEIRCSSLTWWQSRSWIRWPAAAAWARRRGRRDGVEHGEECAVKHEGRNVQYYTMRELLNDNTCSTHTWNVAHLLHQPCRGCTHLPKRKITWIR